MDDHWFRDVLASNRVRETVLRVEAELDAVCQVLTRRDVERDLGRDLSNGEWERVRTSLRRLWTHQADALLRESAIAALSDA